MTGLPNIDPTRSQYGAYSAAYDYFNQGLFGGGLPRCIQVAWREGMGSGRFKRKTYPPGNIQAE